MVIRAGRVLVTGGAGMVGSTIVDQLLDQEVDEIVVIDDFTRGRRENLRSALQRGRVRVTEGDIRDRDLVAKTMEGVEIVFHQAALRVTQCAAEPRAAVGVLVDGTLNVAEAAVAAGVSRVVAASSASVYGAAVEFPTPEAHHPYANRTLYGAAKAFSEGLLRSFHDTSGLDYVALRYFNVYGPRMDTAGRYTEVLVRWMERVDAGLPPVIFGDGSQTLDLVHVDDVARANLLAAATDSTDEVVNIGSGTETSLRDLAVAVVTAMGSCLEPEYAPGRTVNDVPRRLADTTRARSVLGFRAEVSLHEGLGRLVEWWRNRHDPPRP